MKSLLPMFTWIIFMMIHLPSWILGSESLSERILQDGFSAGWRYLSDLDDLEYRLIENDIFVKEGTPAYRLAMFKRPGPESAAVSKRALRLLATMRNITERINHFPDDVDTLRSLVIHSADRQLCPGGVRCSKTAIYRTADGSCNNLQNPNFGQSMTSLTRLLDSDYSDGISAPRNASNGSPLPNARSVSLQVLTDADLPVKELTLAVMQWGQFVDHDLDSVPVNTLADGSAIACCDEIGQLLPESEMHPQCFPISIPPEDKVSVSSGQACMNFVRSMFGPRPDCRMSPAEQLNEITHWIDGSQIYGSTLSKSQELRSFNGGLLRTLSENDRDLLPLSEKCNSLDCFNAGDGRAREQPFLTVMHTVWMREHNRIAKQLERLNPSWTDETLYQETRRIVIAELQHITYNEWLPRILGPSYLKNYGLLSSAPNHFFGYNTSLNPSVTNEFATAAFRMGHSLIQGFIKLFEENGKDIPKLNFFLSNSFFNVQLLRNDLTWLDSAIRGLYNQPVQDVDNSFTKEVTERLFQSNNGFAGLSLRYPDGPSSLNGSGSLNGPGSLNGRRSLILDLAALNIQRGRDHGIPGYVNYREFCGLSRPKSFEELTEFMSLSAVQAFQKLYHSVDDIDLFIGGIVENHEPGSLLGPTFNCIIAQQFSLLKHGDRFYYELGDQPHSFTFDQLNEIRKVTLARVLCDNNDGSIRSIQPLVFQTADPSNEKTECDNLPIVDLHQWIGDGREEQVSKTEHFDGKMVELKTMLDKTEREAKAELADAIKEAEGAKAIDEPQIDVRI